MLANREGTFHATAINIGVDETGPNKLTTVICEFSLFEELGGEEPIDVQAEGLTITGYFYVEKKDGSLNERTIDSLKAAFGWDGRDLFWLQDTDLSRHPVQVVLGFEEYEGKERLKVRWLNAFGSTASGGVSKADGPKRQAILNRLGPRLRAVSGGVSAPAAMPTGRPAAPGAPAAAAKENPRPGAAASSAAPKSKAKTTRASARSPASPPAECTMDEAWAEFISHCRHPDGSQYSQEDMERVWFEVVEKLFPGKQSDQLTPADWHRMRTVGPDHIVPF